MASVTTLSVRCGLYGSRSGALGAGANGATSRVQLPAGLGDLRLTNGTGDGQINELYYHPALALAASTPQTLDLTALLDPQYGRTVTFSKVKVLYVRSQSATYSHVIAVGNAASNRWSAPWSASTVIESTYGSSPMLKTNLGAGWTVDASNKNLKIDPGANAQTIEILVAGLA